MIANYVKFKNLKTYCHHGSDVGFIPKSNGLGQRTTAAGEFSNGHSFGWKQSRHGV